MKKLILPVVLFSVISCGSNDRDQDPDNKASITGKWSVEKTEIRRSLQQQTQTSFSTDCQKSGTYEFTASHLTSVSFEENNNICKKTGAFTKKYIFNETKREFWFEREEINPYYVAQLSQTDLVVEDRTQDFDGDGIKDIIRRFYKRIN